MINKKGNIMQKVEIAFCNFKKPNIIYSIPNEKKIKKSDFERQQIQSDFSKVTRHDMSSKQCSMMIIDSSLISDDALLYFLPRLAKAVYDEEGDEFLLYRRLEKIQQNILNSNQKKILHKLINELKKLSNERDIEK